MPEQTTEQFKSWGLLELMGRQRVAGELSEQTIGGCSFIRVDIPTVGDIDAHTRYFTSSAIYGMTPMAEATARKLANYLQSAPVSAYELRDAPTMPLLTGKPSRDDDGDDDGGDMPF